MVDSNTVGLGLLNAMKQHAGIAIGLGIVILICGILAIAAPYAAGVSLTIAIGVLFAVGGISQVFLGVKAGAMKAGSILVILGLLTALLGFYLITRPVAGLEALTFMLSVYFIMSGIFELLGAMQIRPRPEWRFMLLNGVVSLLLGVMIGLQYPFSGEWVLGTLLGIKLIFSGMSLIIIGRAAKQIKLE